LHQRWRAGQERGDDLELQADGGQHLSETGVQLPAQALPLELDLAHGAAPASAAPLAGEGGKVAFRRLQAETMLQEAGLQAEQRGSLLAAGGEGGRHAGIRPGACSGFGSVKRVLRTAERQAGPFAHPEQLAA
jgi:hypothetical protein